ncbi:Crp/Fnr family transcriptional regulator [Porphyrobacter sp. GA68]|uniref:Crp/Fnr family transcriptional regulator n=1 Tax=Porphyrobacter sp. GA68 TaxID=2883480 RepID=UPI001D18C23E|nr:Crp/Fnr family transcriptional regulator [Porphyrobacter sp. GA68]
MEQFPLTGRFLMGRLRHAMTPEEQQIVEDLVTTTEVLADGTHFARRGEVLDRSTILIKGYMLRTITLDGRRSIVSVQVPGDFVDLHAFALKRLDHDIVSVGEALVGYVLHDDLKKVMAEQPHLARILWFSTLLDAAIHREWICRLEQLQAAQRVAHIFAELWYRLDMVGIGMPNLVRTPLTQVQLAEMCGVTSIHMNRALGQLRREGIADFRRGTLYVENRAQLEKFGTFSPSYLYGDAELGIVDELSS